MKSIQEKIEVMQHFANGGKVECLLNDGTWRITPEPNWDWWKCTYRIKEQKKTITIKKWLINDGSGNRIIETDNIDNLFSYPIEKVKLLETYEIEL